MLPQIKLDGELASLLASNAQGIDHIAIAVRNLDEALPFYTGVLGLKVTESHVIQGERTGMRFAVLEGGPITFVVVQGTSPISQVSRFIQHYGPGVQHIAIKVVDLESVMENLKARGLEFVTPPLRSNGLLQSFAVRDPESGIMLELTERVDNAEGFADENTSQLFLELEASDLF